MRSSSRSPGHGRCGIRSLRFDGQFAKADGSKVEDAKITTLKVVGQDATRVDVSGEFVNTMAQPGQGAAPKSDQRLLAAIVPTAEGPYYIKFLGPSETIASHAKAFDGLIESIVAAP